MGEIKRDRKKRVLIIVENLSVPFDRRVWLEAKALYGAGCVVSVISPRFKYEKACERLEGINIYRYPAPPPTRGIISYMLEFSYCFGMTLILSAWVFIRHGFDIIHACNPPDTFFILGLLYRVFGKKFYYDQHDLCPEVYLSKYNLHRPDFLYRILVLLEFFTYKTADRVIVTNNSYREIALSRGRLRDDKVIVVRTGPDIERFALESMPEPHHFKKGKRFLVVYLGVMAPQDGVDYLLYSIELVMKKHMRDDILFVLIGEGDSWGYLRALKTKLGLDGMCLFTGRVPDERLAEYLLCADLCVAPDPKNALNEVSTMNKVLEYMAAGRPIVSFELRETKYSAGEAAIYARPNDIEDFADKIIYLLANESKRSAMAETAKRRLREIKELTWGYNRERLLRAYDI